MSSRAQWSPRDVRVLLIRHGRSAHLSPARALDRRAIGRWLEEYDEAGIAPHERPPSGLVAEVARAAVIAASDMPRALASAALLAPGRHVEVSSLLREVPLPLPALPTLRAPLPVWAALIHLRWVLSMMRGSDTMLEARERARGAAQWCRAAAHGAAPEGGTVAVVTHGAFRRFLGQELVRDGWRPEARRGGYAHWSVWRFRHS